MDAQGFACSESNSIMDEDAHALAKLPREIQLIKHVAREQALYNPKHEFYRNAARKDVKWGEIGTAIGWTELQCKAKWKAFRDQYCRELKRSKINTKATVKWKYFKYLEFLRPFALSRNYRPRFMPNNASGTNLSSCSTGTDDHKKNITAAIIASDYSLLQNIKMEPKPQQDEQTDFVDECAALSSAMHVAAAEQQNVKNETIVVIAAEQLQHLNNVLQQQQQQQQQHQADNWGFLTNTTNGANTLLTTTSHQQQQLTANTFNHNNNNNNDNNILDAKHIDQTSNSSADYALLHNAIADCVAAAEAEADVSQLSHQSQHHQIQTKAHQHQQQQHQHQQGIYMFQSSTPPTVTTSSDEEDDDPIHKFLNIESYFEKELIAMVQSEDILYNSFHPNYRNTKRKLDVWADIARKMKKTVKQCRLKWKALRDQYIREHKRLRNRINIETLPRWKHYDALNFLHNFIKHKSESEDKKIFQLMKHDSVNNSGSLLKNQAKDETQQQQQQQMQLHPALIGISNALAEHQRQQHPYHEDLTNNVTISSSSSSIAPTTAAPNANEVPVNATSLVNIDENQSNSVDDYDAIDIDNYINGNSDTNDIVMHENADDDEENDDDDDDDEEGHTMDNADENGKSVKNIPNFNHTNHVGCTIDNAISAGGIESTQNQLDPLPTSDFRKLKDIVSRTNSPVLLSISNSQQQLCQQTQNQQHPQHQQQHIHQHHQDDNDHIMQVVGLSCEDVVVLNETNAAQLGFVVPSSATATTSATTKTTALASTKTSLAMQQQNFTEHLVKLTAQTSVSPTSTSITASTLPALSASNGNAYNVYNTNTNNSNSNNNNNNNSNNISNNNISISAAAAVHDVGSVFSAMTSCADFAATFDDCSTPTMPTTSIPSSLTATTTTTSTISNQSSLALSCGILNPTLATTTLTPASASASTSTTTATANGSTAALSAYASAFEDDEVGVFFKAIAMKIRSVNLSPIEFTDLQIEVLRVINQSLRKN